MSVWFITWVVVFFAPEPTWGTAQEKPRFETKDQCELALLIEEPRMPDWFRGAQNLTLDVEVHVKGACEVDGQPS